MIDSHSAHHPCNAAILFLIQHSFHQLALKPSPPVVLTGVKVNKNTADEIILIVKSIFIKPFINLIREMELYKM